MTSFTRRQTDKKRNPVVRNLGKFKNQVFKEKRTRLRNLILEEEKQQEIIQYVKNSS